MFYLKNKTVRHIHLLQKLPHCVCAEMHFWLSCPREPIYKSFAEFKSSSFLQFQLFFGSTQHWSGHACFAHNFPFMNSHWLFPSITLHLHFDPKKPRRLRAKKTKNALQLTKVAFMSETDSNCIRPTAFCACNTWHHLWLPLMQSVIMFRLGHTLYIHCQKKVTMLSLGW